ncbi:MAG: CsbD family protein [Bdellovibrionales bacterium]|nr:CsbD family protein [Bdellovibrionales bacterium]
MNKDQIKGNWEQIRGDIKKRWGKLTDNDIMEVKGNLEKLQGKLREYYGYTKEQVRQQIEDFQIKSH